MEARALRVAGAPDRERIRELYRQLRAAYGPQGWWPLARRAGRPGFDLRGYHVGNRDHALTPADRFEICTGAVLTQNTAWTNVETALERLRGAGVRLPRDMLAIGRRRLAGLIRSSGYFNQKARKLELLASFFRGPRALSGSSVPGRAGLLALWGVGPETADSILLYAFGETVFVVDAYTRRLLGRLGIISGRERYEHVQDIFHRSLRRSAPLYGDYHALVVAHAKRHCRTRPICDGCPVRPCAWRDRGPHPSAGGAGSRDG